MSMYQSTLKMLVKHWPLKVTEDDELVCLMASIFSRAGVDEYEVECFCDLISDELTDAFTRGQDSVYMSQY